MQGRHLPPGQGAPQDMGRRRPYSAQHQQYPASAPMYNGYVPYNNNYYTQQIPPQYQHPGMHPHYAPHYVYGRTPPQMQQHYSPVALQQSQYPRHQQSPAVASTPYPPPTVQQSSQQTQTPSPESSHTLGRSSATGTSPVPSLPLAVPSPKSQAAPPRERSPSPPPTTFIPFQAPLPWFSRPELPWPARRPRRRRKQHIELSSDMVKLPTIQNEAPVEHPELVAETPVLKQLPEGDSQPSKTQSPCPNKSTNHPAPENHATPSSATQAVPATDDRTTPDAPKPKQRGAVPIIPAVPQIPRQSAATTPSESFAAEQQIPLAIKSEISTSEIDTPTPEQPVEETAVKSSAPPSNAWATKKSWTGVFNNGSANLPPTTANGTQSAAPIIAKPKEESLANALRTFDAGSNSKISFLEPRGLVNTGNMCYMNSVLQVLIFCTPFYDFLDQVSKRTAHSFNSKTPLIDAMIMIMREYRVIDSAQSVEKLRLRLKDGELEQYGEAFTPDFVYEAMRALPRFVSMQRGHQQDAEEFLGFLLEGLHEECLHVMQADTSETVSPTNGAASPTSSLNATDGDVWQQVGPKQKAAITRSSGTITTGSPITKIFGGNLRSEFRVPGLQKSVTLQPYQPLQLDIGASNIHNIVDALKGLTESEPMHGDFKSPKGPSALAYKQVFIETVPPVLILHLKRFQYDNTGGAQKIWKKIGYPLELELPQKVFPPSLWPVLAHSGLPKYRLIAAVYHHGKNASGGHYTVDVRRQDAREWIRLDDTFIRRVRSEEVAEGGSEEDPKAVAAATDGHKKDSSSSGNPYSSIAVEDASADEDDGWKKAIGSSRKWSSVANGTSTTAKAKSEKFSVTDNKVAYLLFYQKI